MEKINNLEPTEKKKLFNEPSGRMWVGIGFIIVGGFLLAKNSGLDLPYWLFSGHMVIVLAGLFFGARRSFKIGIWIIPTLIGIALILEDVFDDFSFRPYLWPLAIIGVGLIIIFRSSKKKDPLKSWGLERDVNDDTIRVTSVWSGTKENVISKDFKGGEITSVMGGSEINLTQADMTAAATIDITNVMGGTVIIVPSHWAIKSDIVCILGGVDEKRAVGKNFSDPSKVLRLTGTCLLGGVEIKSY